MIILCFAKLSEYKMGLDSYLDSIGLFIPTNNQISNFELF